MQLVNTPWMQWMQPWTILEPIQCSYWTPNVSYVNAKAIKLIDLFVGFAQLKWHYIKPLGSSLVFKYKPLSTQAQWGPGQGLKNITWHLEQLWSFGATLNKWLAKKLGCLKYRVRICSGTTWLDFWCIL